MRNQVKLSLLSLAICFTPYLAFAAPPVPNIPVPPQGPAPAPTPELRQFEGRPMGYFDRQAPIVRHPARSGAPIPPESSMTGLSTELRVPNERVHVTLDGKYRFAKLPACAKREVKRQEVFHYSPMSDLMDMVFYDGTNPAERKTADRVLSSKIIARGVSYVGGVELTTSDPRFNGWAHIGATLRIPCLPTRTRTVTDAGKRFMEFRHGDAAWETTPQDAENLYFLQQMGEVPAVETAK